MDHPAREAAPLPRRPPDAGPTVSRPAGVIIGTEGSGDGQEIMLLLDGLDRAMFVKRRAVQLL